MTEPARHLHLVDRVSGEAEEACPGCQRLLKTVSAVERENTRLRNEERERLGLADDANTIMGVLTHHKLLFPGSKIIRGKAAWKNVKARLADVDAETAERAFTPLHLKAAAMGLKLGRAGARADRPHGAAWLYEDPDRVQYWIGLCVTFKRDMGTSALGIVDELGRPGLERLAARCSCCGHLRLDHERERPELDLFDPPCAVHGCGCPGFDDFDWKIDVWKAQRDRERMGAA